MTLKASVSRLIRNSVPRTMNPGHSPMLLSSITARAEGMIRPVRGRAIRLVSIKCIGKELK